MLENSLFNKVVNTELNCQADNQKFNDQVLQVFPESTKVIIYQIE